MRKEASPEKVVQEIRRKTRRRFSAEPPNGDSQESEYSQPRSVTAE